MEVFVNIALLSIFSCNICEFSVRHTYVRRDLKCFIKFNANFHSHLLDESTLSKSMTLAAGTSQLQTHRAKANRIIGNDTRLATTRSTSRNEKAQNGSESDTSGSPTDEFSNTPTYRIPTKSTRGICKSKMHIKVSIYISHSLLQTSSGQTQVQSPIMTIRRLNDDQIRRVT